MLERLAKVDMDTYYGFTAAVQFGVNHAIQCIKEAPAADVAPVRHGRWIDNTFCSCCGGFDEDDEGNIIQSFHNCCPACGALMDGKEVDHD